MQPGRELLESHELVGEGEGLLTWLVGHSSPVRLATMSSGEVAGSPCAGAGGSGGGQGQGQALDHQGTGKVDNLKQVGLRGEEKPEESKVP